MVTSNKLLDKKIVKMAEQNNSVVVPQRTLLGEVNEHITCPLCRGYYIDATTIVECLHSFCRSCIIKHLQVKSYCPVCEMMINSAKPNIKLDKALQDIVYKLVPGLFQKEMERRQQFYSSRPGPAASATPEQRGEDTERIIFSPEDVISFSLEYSDATDTDSISSKSSDSNEPQSATGTTRRFLQCPAVVNISHLKKFLSMKYDIDSTQFAIDILYKRVPLPDYYTLMDIAYIYNWKRNEPMRFFYQIIDYVAIRNRLFDIKSRKSSPTPTEDTNVSSPAPNLNDHGSEMSSGTDSPMPDENSGKKTNNTNTDKTSQQSKGNSNQDKPSSSNSSTSKKNDDEVEKSQFLNSFELTAKNNSQPVKSSPVKGSTPEKSISSINDTAKDQVNLPKVEESLKRKQQTPPKTPEMKKLKIELEKAKIPCNIGKEPSISSASSPATTESSNKSENVFDSLMKKKGVEDKPKSLKITSPPANTSTREPKPLGVGGKTGSEGTGMKRAVPGSTNMSSPKRKPTNELPAPSQPASQTKQVSPLKLQIPKLETQTKSSMSMPKPSEVPKPPPKRMPDLKPTTPSSQTSQSRGPPVNKLRMDLLANNCDPTMDRSRIMSQVKSSLGTHNTGQTSGDPLKSLLLDSCKINIPSSLSITLTDQKLDLRSPNDPNTSEPKNSITNKNLVPVNTAGTAHKVPSPPVHNYIEILKLPDSNPKKNQFKTDCNTDNKSTPQGKMETSTAQPKPSGKSSESSAKGPVPNLKPIADTKLGKQSGNFASPITFQQTFEQQLQSLQSDKKSKLPKNKAQVPKLVPATPKSFSAANKLNNPVNKSPSSSVTMMAENKPSAALDLTTPHNIQSQIGQHQSRLLESLETMQSIANLAKKQNQPVKGLPTSMAQGNVYSSISNRPATTGTSPLRIPNPISQAKHDKISPGGLHTGAARQDIAKPFPLNQAGGGNSLMSSPSYQPISHNSPNMAQPSPRSQTRSPSSSPKLVIAEEKQASSTSSDSIVNQSNQISSTQLPNLNLIKNESPKAVPGPSKPGPKPMKLLTPSVKLTGIRQPITPTLKSSPSMNVVPTDYMTSPQLLAQHAAIMPHIRHQMQMQNWYKAKQYDYIKSISNAVQNQHDFNNKDKQ